MRNRQVHNQTKILTEKSENNVTTGTIHLILWILSTNTTCNFRIQAHVTYFFKKLNICKYVNQVKQISENLNLTRYVSCKCYVC